MSMSYLYGKTVVECCAASVIYIIRSKLYGTNIEIYISILAIYGRLTAERAAAPATYGTAGKIYGDVRADRSAALLADVGGAARPRYP